MPLEIRDMIHVGSLIFAVGAMYATVKSESRHQSEQHAELKEATTGQSAEIGRRIDRLRETIENVSGNSREHGAKIDNLEGRVKRNEDHIDQLVHDFGGLRRT